MSEIQPLILSVDATGNYYLSIGSNEESRD